MNEFNPNSHDAQFAKINERLSDQDRQLALLPEIFNQTKKTNGRVTRLEVIVSLVIFCAGITATAVVQHLIR